MAARHHATIFGFAVFSFACPLNSLTFLGAPVLHRDRPVEALSAMLDAMAAHPTLPKLLCANDIATDGAVLPALVEALARRGVRAVEIDRRMRAKLEAPGDGQAYLNRSLSSKRRAELRRQRKKLGEHGRLTHVSHRTPAEVVPAFQEFLELEAAGWKGRRRKGGRAIQNSRSLANFARTMIAGLAQDSCAGIDALRLDGRPVAMNVWLRSGRGAFGWKMTYDEVYAKWSPGTLLIEDMTNSFLSDGCISFIDSCNRRDATALAQIWTERRGIVDLVIDARRGGSASGRLAAATEYLYRRARGMMRRTYLTARSRWRR
ncbi:GNAT family N-acetyltransferase [Hansschlegelia zhihuaiae]|uniref:GNAT family N-acetyltransferase n=1 Tax=Hansschlegelia zhihuaiae TaxID=405005 RepID=UPI001FE17FDB|nr:GNAT family N-acetyltransferase [Hansschlegelia zhihuaiae]